MIVSSMWNKQEPLTAKQFKDKQNSDNYDDWLAGAPKMECYMYDGHGNLYPITSSCFMLDFPRKERGRVLSEIDDAGFLKWLLGVVVENEDSWMERGVRMRLKELE